MTQALILINIEARGLVESVMDKLEELDEIKCAAFITGPHDFMAIADGNINEIITKIRKIEGVRATFTNVVVEEHVSKGWKKRF